MAQQQQGQVGVFAQLRAAAICCCCLLQAVWALGNIAGDSPQCRNMVLQAGALPPLLEQLGDQQKVSMQRNATWTLSNFCRGKPPPDFSVVSLLASHSNAATRPKAVSTHPKCTFAGCQVLVQLLAGSQPLRHSHILPASPPACSLLHA